MPAENARASLVTQQLLKSAVLASDCAQVDSLQQRIRELEATIAKVSAKSVETVDAPVLLEQLQQRFNQLQEQKKNTTAQLSLKVKIVDGQRSNDTSNASCTRLGL